MSKKHFSQLNRGGRDRIEALLSSGHNQAEIARVLKVDKSTISREIFRRKKQNGKYDADVANHKAGVRRSNSKYQGMKIEKDQKLKRLIVTMLKEKRSPDEIAGRLRKTLRISLGKNAIYKWLYSSFGQKYCKYLCTQRYRKRRQRMSPKREMIRNRIHLSQRPTTVGLLHLQGDTAVSPRRSRSKAAAVFVAEPVTKIFFGRKTTCLKPSIVSKVMREEIQKIKADTITLDNGIENKNHEELGIPSFFCDPHAPWQKPHVENGIGLLRRWFVPKGTDWNDVTEKELQKYLHTINSKYRKSLGYESAIEVAERMGILRTLTTRVAVEGGI